MDGACSTYGVEEKFRRILMGKIEEKIQFEDIFQLRQKSISLCYNSLLLIILVKFNYNTGHRHSYQCSITDTKYPV
jgi:hypothetical protein